MKSVAREMNLSETAFLSPLAENAFHLRWLTPTVEVDLCGHATLASAHWLWEIGQVAKNAQISFSTRSGTLRANAVDHRIELDFPAIPTTPAHRPEGIEDALGCRVVECRRAATDLLITIESAEQLRELRPDFGALSRVGGRGIIVTTRSDADEYDFISRFFAPAAGVDEDPVTGSAHCALGPYWGAALRKRHLVGYQASPRGGVVGVRCEGERVALVGEAITVLRGEILGWDQSLDPARQTQ
jgi:PhzF family phenazine biosynthesis protein